MKRISKLILMFTLLIVCVATLTACGKNKEKEVTSRVQIDVNPSVELLVDEKNIVVSVSGLNEEGKMIVAGEEIVGKDVDEASKIVVDVMLQTGFIIKGSVSASENEIKVSVTSNIADVQASINEKINAKVNQFLEENDVEAKITAVQAYTKEQVEKMLLAMDATITASEAKAMELTEIYKQMSEIRKEQAKLYSEALVEMYNNAKATEIKLLEKEEVAQVINGLDATYQAVKNSYSEFINSLEEAVAALDKARFDNLVDPECNYQKSYQTLKDARIEIVTLENEVASLPEGAEKTIKVATLSAKKTAYTALAAAFDAYYQAANLVIDVAIDAVNKLIDELEKIEESLPQEIKSQLEENTKNLENKINEAKDSFFENFEKEYKDTIDKINKEVEDYKNSLKEANK